MSGTLTVKELIKELLEFDMDEPVFIGLGKNALRPSGSSKLNHVSFHDHTITCGFGVYIHPADCLDINE